MRYIAFVLILSAGAFAAATDLTGHVSVDNEFSLYLSTDDSQLGTFVTNSTDWTTPTDFTVSLNPGTTYFLHVVAVNDGGPDMFIGTFGLSDTGFSFSNGGQSLNTDTINWKGNLTGFGNAYSTPLDYGTTGQSPWGTLGMDANAHFIWMDINNGTAVNNYFTTTITPNAVPEPTSMSALALGAIGIIARRRRRIR